MEERQNAVRFHVADDVFVGMFNEKCTYIIYIVILLINNELPKLIDINIQYTGK